MKHCRTLVFSLFVAILFILGCAASETDDNNPVIKLHDPLSESQWINNAIAKFIIENGYGYPVQTIAESTPAMQEALPIGAIDINLEGWQQNIIEWYNLETEKGAILNLGMLYEGGPQFFMIPQRVAEEYGIESLADMKDHWKLFQDPQDPAKGVFYNCIVGWRCASINEVKLEAYGLDQYYNIVSPGSATALTSVLENAQEMSQPVFGYYWEPSSLAAEYDWHILAEPPYNPECWDKVIAASEDRGLRPIDEACAYENLPIDKLSYAGLPEKAPEVVDMLKEMVVGLEPLNETMAWSKKNDVQDWEKAAIYYLQNHEERWRSWVTPEAYDQIKEALEKSDQEPGS